MITLLYDSDCGLCKCAVVWAMARDQEHVIEPVPIVSVRGAELLADLALDQRLASVHVVDRSGRRFSGGAALPVVLGELRGWRWSARFAALCPPLTEAGYRYVAGHRATLSRFISRRAKQQADQRLQALSEPAR